MSRRKFPEGAVAHVKVTVETPDGKAVIQDGFVSEFHLQVDADLVIPEDQTLEQVPPRDQSVSLTAHMPGAWR